MTKMLLAAVDFDVLCPHMTHTKSEGLEYSSETYQTFSGQMGTKLRDKPTVDEMKKSGFSVYENQGDGIIKKLSEKVQK